MRMGTKSVLFGAHCFFLHPWFVAWAWWKLFGFPWDPRLWVAFFVHDLGYWGKPNMDGKEGEEHVFLGANWMRRWFGDDWYEFCIFHSRFMAKHYNLPVSKLCYADKLSICLTPAWLYLPMVRWSGEIYEYMKLAEQGQFFKYSSMGIPTDTQLKWYNGVQEYLRSWVAEHKDGREDTWTPKVKQAITKEGVWK